jgi:hypothetical protein
VTDLFVKIQSNKGRARLADNRVRFSTTAVSIPAVIEKRRADWEWNGNGMLRLRGCDDGDLKVFPIAGARALRVATRSVETALGRELRGMYPIARVDGNDIYIDIRDEARIA